MYAVDDSENTFECYFCREVAACGWTMTQGPPMVGTRQLLPLPPPPGGGGTRLLLPPPRMLRVRLIPLLLEKLLVPLLPPLRELRVQLLPLLLEKLLILPSVPSIPDAIRPLEALCAMFVRCVPGASIKRQLAVSFHSNLAAALSRLSQQMSLFHGILRA